MNRELEKIINRERDVLIGVGHAKLGYPKLKIDEDCLEAGKAHFLKDMRIDEAHFDLLRMAEWSCEIEVARYSISPHDWDLVDMMARKELAHTIGLTITERLARLNAREDIAYERKNGQSWPHVRAEIMAGSLEALQSPLVVGIKEAVQKSFPSGKVGYFETMAQVFKESGDDKIEEDTPDLEADINYEQVEKLGNFFAQLIAINREVVIVLCPENYEIDQDFLEKMKDCNPDLPIIVLAEKMDISLKTARAASGLNITTDTVDAENIIIEALQNAFNQKGILTDEDKKFIEQSDDAWIGMFLGNDVHLSRLGAMSLHARAHGRSEIARKLSNTIRIHEIFQEGEDPKALALKAADYYPAAVVDGMNTGFIMGESAQDFEAHFSL